MRHDRSATPDIVVPSEHESMEFPLAPVIILALCITLHAYTLANLFPYVGLMVKELMGLETTNEAGFYAGYVASSFTFGRLVSGYALGHATDSIGRKPVIIIGLLSICVFSLSFGMSTSLAFAVSSRLALGLTNGLMPAIRASVREVCGPEHVVVGMVYISGCKGISIVLGTGVGGLLAQPAARYPSVFSETGLFGENPFLLPNLVGACAALAILPLVIVYLPETKDFGKQHTEGSASSDDKPNGPASPESLQELPPTPGTRGSLLPISIGNGTSTSAAFHDGDERRQHQRREHSVDLGETNGTVRVASTNGSGGGESNGPGADRDEEPGLWGSGGLMRMPNVIIVLFIACIVQTVNIGFDEAYPLWALSTADVGGLGWGAFEIGTVLVLAGLFMAVAQFLLFPPLIKILGIVTWQRIGCVLGVPVFLSIPAAKLLSWNEVSLFAVSVGTVAFVNCSLATINLALAVASTCMVPANMRGKLGGLFNTAESLGRFIGPAGFAITFAWSISPSAYEWVNYRFVFYLSAFLIFLVTVLGWRTITLEKIMQPAEPEDTVSAPADIAGGGPEATASFLSTPDRGVNNLV